ncbi:MAG: TolC family protein [Candidatus Zixiibacteriota bacterium]|nr:MAG: TolC family protein [candidate division Zixibacteria bacterium]
MKLASLTYIIPAVLINITSAGLTQTITQEEFLTMLKRVHPLFEKENLTARIEEKNKQSLTGGQDWNINSSAIFSHEEPAIAIFGPERTDALSLTGSVDRLFWRTGGFLNTSLTFNRVNLKVDPMLGIPDSYYQNQFSVSYAHPLLQNKAGFLNRLQYNLKQYDIDFAGIQALENQEGFLAESAAKFLEWVYLHEQNNIILERLKLSEEALVNATKKREANLIDEVDLLRAEDAVAIAKQNLVLGESRFKGLQAELAVLTQNNSLYDLKPEHNLYKFEVLPLLEEIISDLKQKSRLIAAINTRVRQLEYSRLGFEETMEPSLSILAQFNLKKADKGFGNALGLDKPDFIGGLQFSLPLERRTAKYNISRTDLQIRQLEMQREEITLGLVAALTNLYIQITEMENILELNLEQIESARSKTVEELKLYNRGRSDLTFVIQSQDGEQNAKLNYAVNALTYHQLYLRYLALTDAILK